MPKVAEFKYEHEGKVHCHQYHLRCPGCKCTHAIGVGIHSFNGDFEKPTFQPSLLCTGTRFTEKGEAEYKAWCDSGYPERNGAKFDSKPDRCHSYVTNGMIQFLSDCTHELAGQTVELPEFVNNGNEKYNL
jgi:hypothetical protein